MAQVTEQDCIFEVEHTSQGEMGLFERQRVCIKNPKHTGFYPIKTFSVNDLPARYQTEEIVKLVQNIADLTVRIRVFYTSMSRPTKFPESDQSYAGADLRGCPTMRVGSGFISNINIEREGEKQNGFAHCPCYSCRFSRNPEKVWGVVTVVTAAHVLCTPDELVHAELDCFYNDDQDKDTTVKILCGSTMRANENPITKVDFVDDFCQFVVITHDIDLCLRLSKFKLSDLLKTDLGLDCSNNTVLTIIVSHMHGCPKCVSWGEWTSREDLTDPDGVEKMRYIYNTPTCPGSSGALVWMLEASKKRCQRVYVHSAGLTNGLNISGAVEMFCEFITNSIDCHIS